MTTGKTSLLVQIAGHRLERQLCRVYSIGDKQGYVLSGIIIWRYHQTNQEIFDGAKQVQSSKAYPFLQLDWGVHR